MLDPAVLSPASPILYPESDGRPLAENTKQLRWIVVLFGNISALFRERSDVFVAADLLWYPVEGHPEIRIAPDTLVVLGRPKGDRGSYLQWLEEGVPVTVVFEVLSPGNSVPEMIDKLTFYEEHGVEEYYVYDPDTYRFFVYLRRGSTLMRERRTKGFVSPRLGIRFEPKEGDMEIYYPDGRRFLTFEELEAERTQAQQQAQQAREQVQQAQQQAQQAEERAEQAHRRAERLAALSRKVRRQQASPEELAELERLEEEAD
jgi:Uma2 family endonuclease